MKYYILSFICVMCISCALAGSRNAKSYSPVGVDNVEIKDDGSVSAQKQDNLVGEQILVDLNRTHSGAATVRDTKT